MVGKHSCLIGDERGAVTAIVVSVAADAPCVVTGILGGGIIGVVADVCVATAVIIGVLGGVVIGTVSSVAADGDVTCVVAVITGSLGRVVSGIVVGVVTVVTCFAASVISFVMSDSVIGIITGIIVGTACRYCFGVVAVEGIAGVVSVNVTGTSAGPTWVPGTKSFSGDSLVSSS